MARDLPQERPTGKEPVARRKPPPKKKPPKRDDGGWFDGLGGAITRDLGAATGRGLGDIKKLPGRSWGDVKELTGAVIPGGKAAAKALYRDIKDPLRGHATAGLIVEGLKGYANDIDRFTPLDWSKESFSDPREWRKSVSAFKRDIAEMNDAWNKDPVVGAVTFLPVVGGVSRVLRTLKAAAGGATPTEAIAAGYRPAPSQALKQKPGFKPKPTRPEEGETLRSLNEIAVESAKAQGIKPPKGGKRVVTKKWPPSGRPQTPVPEGPTRTLRSPNLPGEVRLPGSRSETGRVIQSALDQISDALEALRPGTRGSTSARGWKALERQSRDDYRRAAAGLRQAEIDLGKVSSRGAKARAALKAGGPLGFRAGGDARAALRGEAVPSPVEEALVAALEAPRGMSIPEAVRIKIDALERHGADEPAVVQQIGQLRTALRDHDLDSDTVQDALAAMETISEQAEIAAIQIAHRRFKGDPAKLHQVLDALDARKQLVSDFYLESILGKAKEAFDNGEMTKAEYDAQVAAVKTRFAVPSRRYFPHRSLWDLPSEVSPAPTRLPASGGTIGRPTRTGVQLGRNQLIRLRGGEVLADPTVLIEILRTRLRFLQTLKARDELYAAGKPIAKGEPRPKGRFVFIRDPDKPPERLKDEIKAAQTMADDDYVAMALRAGEDLPDTEQELLNATGDLLWSSTSKTPEPPWMADLENVRYVPQATAARRVGEVFYSGPRSNAAAALGIANAAMRFGKIYAPDLGARYVVRNAVQNLVMGGLTNPLALRNLVLSQKRLRRGGTRERALYHQILSEAGNPLARALPERTLRTQTGLQRREDTLASVNRRVADRLSSLADDPMRSAVWLEHARREGIDVNDLDQLDDVLNRPDFEDVRRRLASRTRQDLIDFDALSPFEREVVTRFVFLYPLVKGSSAWPLTFMREHPLMASAVVQAAATEEEGPGVFPPSLRERSIVGQPGAETRLDWLDPAGILQENLQRAENLVTKGDVPGAADMLTPAHRAVIEAAGGRPRPWGERVGPLGRTFVPGWADIERLREGGGEPGSLLTGAAGNIIGRDVEIPRAAKEERAGRAAEINERIDRLWEAGHAPPPEFYASYEAYEDWKAAEKRALYAAKDLGQTSLTSKQKAQALNSIIPNHLAWKDVPGYGVYTPEQIDSWTEEEAEEWFDSLTGLMFGAREDFVRLTTPLMK